MNKQSTSETASHNLILKGFNSIQTGLYLILFAYILKNMIDGFLSDTSMLGMMSIEIIEGAGLTFLVLFFLLSGFAIFFSSRRSAKKSGVKMWNKSTRMQMINFALLCVAAVAFLFFQKNFGYSSYLGISFLFYLGAILIILNAQKRKPLYLLALISLVLALISYLIPTYWYPSINIMGMGFVVYGIMIKK